MTDYEDVPDSKESWTRTTINEGLGTPGKHADEFYRHGDWGIECDSDGTYEVYVILEDRPIKVEGSLHSFEEAVQCIRAAGKDKSIGDDDSEDIKAEDGKDPEGEDTGNMRDLLEDEHEAVNDYERMADESDDSHTKEVFRDIAREEKVHEGELFLLLLEKDPQQRPAMEEASEESEDMGGPSFREMLESGRAKVVSKARGESFEKTTKGYYRDKKEDAKLRKPRMKTGMTTDKGKPDTEHRGASKRQEEIADQERRKRMETQQAEQESFERQRKQFTGSGEEST